MTSGYEIREIPLSLKSSREAARGFLASQGLRLDSLDRLFGIFDFDDSLLGCAGFKGCVVKDVAVHPSLRGNSVTASLLAQVMEEAFQCGFRHLRLFTKPENAKLFRSMGFFPVGEAEKAVLMETDPRGIGGYRSLLSGMAEGKPFPRGAIVMNCNPLTRGHEYLIRKAASSVAHLFVIPVEEDVSDFSTAERVEMMKGATSGLDNVTLCPGSPYAISASTFPSYFLKSLDDASEAQIDIDIDIFARNIAPALGVSVRFVGSELSDALTAAYNRRLHEVLPLKGVEVAETERLCDDGEPISAGSLRKAIEEGHTARALRLAASASAPYVIGHAVSRALMRELSLTPKPGLVDLEGSGSHNDMDFSLMSQSIAALQPYFVRLARLAMSPEYPSRDEIAAVGIEAEERMLAATGGVNTHRGAIFSLGLASMAASRLLWSGRPFSPEGFSHEIGRLASGFRETANTNGASVRKKYGLKGILESAAEGFPTLFDSWLPFLERVRHLPESSHLLLLKIISELDDTNLYHRGGKEGALWAQREALGLLGDFSMPRLRNVSAEFVKRNLSPGGSADMLALTLFIDSFLHA